MTTGTAFLQSIIKRLLYYKELADKTFLTLEENNFHYQYNEESNSIAIIIQHIAGNMISRWTDFLTSDGEKEWRNRDKEFEKKLLTKEEIIDLWEKGWHCCMSSLQSLTEADLLAIIYIRGEKLIALEAINRQLAHYPYHVGQIIYIAKMIKNSKWQSLSIPKNGSEQFNDFLKKDNMF
ncbi:MAG: DUF1572 family protein [Chitinophagaceae bacterium]|nr:DUF1572 family protein [Chitinophagaceae bacterium]